MVLVEGGDAVAGTHTGGAQGAGQSSHALVELRPCPPDVARRERLAVGCGGRPALDEVVDAAQRRGRHRSASFFWGRAATRSTAPTAWAASCGTARTSASHWVTAGNVRLRAVPPTSSPMWPAWRATLSARSEPASPARGITDAGGVTWSWVPYTLRNGQRIAASSRTWPSSTTSPVNSPFSRLSRLIISTNAAPGKGTW